MLAILTFVELFKVRWLGRPKRAQPPCEQLLARSLRTPADTHSQTGPPQVNLVKVPEYGRDATKGIATAMSMSFSMPPNLVLFLWMMLTKYGMQFLYLALTRRWKT